MTKDSFLPEGYEVPEAPSKYMRLVKGINKFRILSKPIVGNKYWVDTKEGRKPVRKRPDENIDLEEVDINDQVKHFWAMPVWNYEIGAIQVLEITQRSVLKEIYNIARDSDWGSPLGYDIAITKTGDGMETRYSVSPKPLKPVDPKIKDQFDALKSFDINRLFDNGDPFGEDEKNDPTPTQTVITGNKDDATEINLEDVPF